MKYKVGDTIFATKPKFKIGRVIHVIPEHERYHIVWENQVWWNPYTEQDLDYSFEPIKACNGQQ